MGNLYTNTNKITNRLSKSNFSGNVMQSNNNLAPIKFRYMVNLNETIFKHYLKISDHMPNSDSLINWTEDSNWHSILIHNDDADNQPLYLINSYQYILIGHLLSVIIYNENAIFPKNSDLQDALNKFLDDLAPPIFNTIYNIKRIISNLATTELCNIPYNKKHPSLYILNDNMKQKLYKLKYVYTSFITYCSFPSNSNLNMLLSNANIDHMNMYDIAIRLLELWYNMQVYSYTKNLLEQEWNKNLINYTPINSELLKNCNADEYKQYFINVHNYIINIQKTLDKLLDV